MAVVIETTLGDITVDLFLEQRPVTCLNFLKLCKMKYYNFNLFHTIRSGFIAQTGDPTGEGSGGESIFGILEGPEKRFFSGEKMPKIRHTDTGLLSMVGTGDMMIGSQFYFTLGSDLDSLDGSHCVIGTVTDGHEVLRKLSEVICDESHRPYQDVRITHTVVLEDPFSDPTGLKAPSRSPSPSAERLRGGRIAPDEKLDETQGKSAAEIQELIEEKEAKARATILEIVGDLPDADIAPPENVLFVCKLNPVTTDEDLEIIFSRFGKIVSCEVIRDKKTGDSLQYAFIEFDNKKSCEEAYFKMDNVLIDDRRIHVDFSQSVSKIKWLGKGRGVRHLNDDEISSRDNNSEKYISKRPRSRERNEYRDRSQRGKEISKDHRQHRDGYNNKGKSNRNHQRDEHTERSKDKRQREEETEKGRERRTRGDRTERSRDRQQQQDEENSRRRQYREKDYVSSERRDTKEKDYAISERRENRGRDDGISKRNETKGREENSFKNKERGEDNSRKENKEKEERHRERKEKNDENSRQQEIRKITEVNSMLHHGIYSKKREDEERNKVKSKRESSRDRSSIDQPNYNKKNLESRNNEKFTEEETKSSRHNREQGLDHKNYDNRVDQNNKKKRKNDAINVDREETNNDSHKRRRKVEENELKDKKTGESQIIKDNTEKKTSKHDKYKDKNIEIRTPTPKGKKREQKITKNKNKIIKKSRAGRKKRKHSTSSDSDSSSTTSSSSDSSSSDSDHKKSYRRRRKRRRSSSSSSSSTSSSSSSSSDSSSDSSSSSSESDARKKKRSKKSTKIKRSKKIKKQY